MNVFKIINFSKEIMSIFKESTLNGVIVYVLFKLKFTRIKISNKLSNKSKKTISFIGAGTHQISINLPCAMKSNFIVQYVFTNGSISSKIISKILKNVSVINKIKHIPKTDAVLIGSPHNLHPVHLNVFIKKNVYIYCEKPVAINESGIKEIKKIMLSDNNYQKIMVGFNRRFAPLINKLKCSKLFSNRLIEINYRVNFGATIDNNMTDKKIGGGRLIGICCHYVDLISYISESEIEYVSAIGLKENKKMSENSFTSVLKLKNGSIANLNFTSSGNRRVFPKETIYISGGGNVARIYNFETLYLNNKKIKSYRNNYGSLNTWKKFYDIVYNGKKSEISLLDGIRATEVTLAIKKSLYSNGKLQKV